MNLTKTIVLAVFILLAASCLRAMAQSLDGVWEITAVIDNGRVVEPTEVLTELCGRRSCGDSRAASRTCRADDVSAQAVAVHGGQHQEPDDVRYGWRRKDRRPRYFHGG